MSPGRKQRTEDQEDRLNEAEKVADVLAARESEVNRQLGLIRRLSEGWRRVHERNHLAQIFHEQGGL